MFRDLPKYAEATPNSFWSTRTPAHWAVRPGLAVLKENRRKNTGLIETQVLSLSYGQVVVKPIEKQHGLVPESYEGYQVLEPGDIVVRPTDLQNDQTSVRVGHVKDYGIITSAYIGLRPFGDWGGAYAYQYLTAIDSTKRIYGMGSGLRQQLGWADLKRMPCLVPPIEEQAAIVKYLAHANARIYKAIDAKRRVGTLLRESRNASIDALLLGREKANKVGSDAPWLESIPSGWTWRRCRTLTNFISSGSRGWAEFYADEGAIFFQSGNLGRNLELKLSNLQRVRLPHASTEGLRTRVEPNDLLVCITGALTGNVAFVPGSWTDEAYVNQHVALVRPNSSEIYPEFLAYALKSLPSQIQFRGSEYGGTKQGLGLDEVKNVEILLPPKSDQREVLNQIREEVGAVDFAVARLEREIALLQEFRTRLVADVVTGQVDVRAIAASLPKAPEQDADLDSLLDDDPEDVLGEGEE